MIISSLCFSNQEGSAFDFGELEEAIVLQGVNIRNDEAKAGMNMKLSVTFFSSPVTSHKKQPVVSFICVRGRDREEFENVCSVGFGEFSISDSVIICGAESGMA